ncbi:MAG: hypothetical protein M0Z95_19505, partial [Actinomycetota bacterium]|nr:hypothetical protein [Actinomycetota bacterium]
MRAHMAMAEDGIDDEHPIHALLNDTFHGSEQWAAFERAARELGTPALGKWVADQAPRLAAQLARRGETIVYTNGAIEALIQTVREAVERSTWTFRNRQRMDLLLELMRLNKVNSTEA